MRIADPSECIDSSSILPTLRGYLNPLVEKAYGGNILMHALKDIAHHFIDERIETDEVLERLFEFEDRYLKDNESDFWFGVYEKK